MKLLFSMCDWLMAEEDPFPCSMLFIGVMCVVMLLEPRGLFRWAFVKNHVSVYNAHVNGVWEVFISWCFWFWIHLSLFVYKGRKELCIVMWTHEKLIVLFILFCVCLFFYCYSCFYNCLIIVLMIMKALILIKLEKKNSTNSRNEGIRSGQVVLGLFIDCLSTCVQLGLSVCNEIHKRLL